MRAEIDNRIMTPAEYKAVLKALLADVHRICHENGLRYCVSFGTLIGAVRHDGFIPWDDDVDICMFREDYERFASIISRDKSGLYLLSPENSADYYFYFPRICSNKGILKLRGIVDIDNLGPFIDIFIMDKVPEDPQARAAFCQKVMEYNNLVRYCVPYRRYRTLHGKQRLRMFAGSLPHFARRMISGTGYYKEKRRQLLLSHNDSQSGLYICAFDRNYEKWVLTEEEASEVAPHRFEDIEVDIPTHYDAILKRQYGDYMALPPEDERVSQHHFIPYWRSCKSSEKGV